MKVNFRRDDPKKVRCYHAATIAQVKDQAVVVRTMRQKRRESTESTVMFQKR